MIKEKLDEYLELDSAALFVSGVLVPGMPGRLAYPMQKPLVRIFGGAIRDIIAGQPIRDVDILVGAIAAKTVADVLEKAGYSLIEGQWGKEIGSIYSDIHVISEPWTFMKGAKIVQLIRPAIAIPKNGGRKRPDEIYEEEFKNLIQNVDISCCGVSWDGKTLYENFPNAISHCINLSFQINLGAKMYSRSRAQARKYKLIGRGWAELSEGTSIARDQRIDAILSDAPPIEYKSELPPGTYGGSWTRESPAWKTT